MKKKINKKTKEKNLSFYKKISIQNPKESETYFKTNLTKGLDLEEVFKRKKIYGSNILEQKKNSFFKKIINVLLNPFNIVLFFLIFFTFFKDIFFKEKKEFSTFLIISIMLFFSNIIYLIQEFKFSKISEKFKKIIQNNINVKRENNIYQINSNEIVVGDIVLLSAGDIIPADIKLFKTKDFFVKETTLTGESDPVEKNSFCKKEYQNILEDKRIIFMGTNVISGSAEGIVISIGNNTYLGKINQIIIKKRSFNYQKDINSIAKLLIICSLLVFPLIFILNWFKDPYNFDFLNIFLFALTIILGMTPEMLPLVTTLSFLHGIVNLSKRKIFVKNLYSIQDLGTMNFLFTDKTGTLTEEKIKINGSFDINNLPNEKVLEYAFLNSYFQTGLKNSIDFSIIKEITDKNNISYIKNLNEEFFKIDEIPFDFKRRVMSVILTQSKSKKTKIISKGAIEEILNISNYFEIFNEKTKFKELIKIDKEKILKQTNYYNQKGMRVIGVSYRNIITDVEYKNIQEERNNLEKNMIIIGFITLFDIPKKSSIELISFLKKNNIKVKILTGDNEILTKNIAKQINIDNYNNFLLGQDIDQMDDKLLYKKSDQINIFAKLNPEQKSRIIEIFRKKNNVVGFMGDGINDAPAMQKANLSISVDSGVDIAKESADILFLTKDLKIIKNAILESRRIYTNILKYIKFTLSSNFSNILSIFLASFYLPFIPLEPIQILFLNLIYDLICIFLPFDNVDQKYLTKPRCWNFRSIINFMIFFGSIGFIFDVFFWLILYKFITKIPSLFQSSWFVFSLWTQIINIIFLRTENFFKNNKMSKFLLLSIIFSFFSTFLIFLIPFVSEYLCFINPFQNKKYIVLLVTLTIIYSLILLKAKKIFIKKNKELL
jgi:Mg2+-importing ATPase